MKRNIFSYKFALYALSLGALTACTRLDQSIYSDIPAESFWKTPAEISAGIAPAYIPLQNMGMQNFYQLVDIAGGEMVIPVRGSDWLDGGYNIQNFLHTADPNSPYGNGTWASLYKGIVSVNQTLDALNILQQKPDGYNAIVAELKILRAFNYYWLIDLFGDVPLVTDSKTDPNTVSRTPRAQVFTFIASEIETNIPNLPDTVNASTYGRVNKMTAYAILAKLYLNAQVYTGTPQWQKAMDAVDAIINSGHYKLSAGYFDNFADDNGPSNTENIFVVPFDKVNITGGGPYRWTLHGDNNKNFGLTSKPHNGWCTTPQYYALFDQTHTDTTTGDKTYRTYADQRTGQWLVGQQYNEPYAYPPDKNILVNAPASEKIKDAATGLDLNINPNFTTLNSGEGSFRLAGARSIKYFPVPGNPKAESNDIVLLRYADILLMKAELELRLNNDPTAAAKYVNMVRERAYSGDTSHDWTPANTTLDNILAERGREMAWEHWRRNDLIRFQVADGQPYFTGAIGTLKPTDADTHAFLLPIPQQQILANPKLTQNPGY